MKLWLILECMGNQRQHWKAKNSVCTLTSFFFNISLGFLFTFHLFLSLFLFIHIDIHSARVHIYIRHLLLLWFCQMKKIICFCFIFLNNIQTCMTNTWQWWEDNTSTTNHIKYQNQNTIILWYKHVVRILVV